ncbi:SAM-dependent methyltransferase [Romboutsia maritimum]|uniref:site-specific DNA-methyltransferase (adenine-specific) n=2 Tax=Romboutsia maritimum TaxID=2020948 RepID=A0A371IX51_9FIRM|nr:SAM-dependent methyltransferase [Romboutsia maritimum]
MSKIYENSLDTDIKKSKGIYYTPKIIVDYIVEKTLKNHDVIKNPYPRVLDISCGCGNFLLEAYDILYNLFEKNIYELADIYGKEYWQVDNIHNHVISNCIYGVDIDKEAIEILKKSLINKNKYLYIEKINIYCTDSLKKTWSNKFDYIIGNPPYIGHKGLDKKYKEYLMKNYNEVYRDKADLYFCFYKKIIDLLDDKGLASVITPRYFLESPSGKYLRNYIAKKADIKEIVDFLGANIFKNIGIASCIMTFCKKKIKKLEYVDVLKIMDESIKVDNIENLREFINNEGFKRFKVEQDSLKDEWIIINNIDKDFYNKIQQKCKYTLEDIAVSFQGIITGCDKAFILDKEDERINKIDSKLIKKWVKNKNIYKYVVKDSNYRLIYSNDIKDEKNNSIVIKECISKYREKLENRRECKNNIRKWYELQWGRDKKLFESVKIMYPYKSKENRFAIDYNNNFSSADVYSFIIKEEYKSEFSQEYLVGILNSSIYDKYFKLTAKKMSKTAYDYYPNKVMKIKIFKDNNYKEIENLSKNIIESLKKSSLDNESYVKIGHLQQKIDDLIKDSLEL